MPKMSLEMAMFNSYISLVRVLHLSKAIHIDDLIAEIGETLDFRRVQHLESAEDHEALENIYKTLVQLAPGLIALQAAREQLKPPGGSGQ